MRDDAEQGGTFQAEVMVGAKALGQEQGEHVLGDSRGLSRATAESAREDLVGKWSTEQWRVSRGHCEGFGFTAGGMGQSMLRTPKLGVCMAAQRAARTLGRLLKGGFIYGGTWRSQ